jgi:hypothetical protein
MKTKTKSGVAWILGGLALVFFSVILEALIFGAGTARANSIGMDLIHSLIKLSDVAGIAFLVFGLIHITIETEDWSDYFRERIREIVMEQSYLSTLDKNRLETLHSSVLKAKFGDQQIDREGGFFNYLRSSIHDYIAKPYREDASATVIYEDAGVDWDVSDRVTYVCRKAGGGIQPNVSWRIDPGESIRVESLKVQIKFPFTHENRGEEKILFEGRPEQDKALVIPLTSYQQIDGLIVIVASKYKVKKDRLQYWSMVNLTKNFDITMKFPPDHEIQEKHLVLSPDLAVTTVNDGFYQAKYDFWILPESGLAWVINPKRI